MTRRVAASAALAAALYVFAFTTVGVDGDSMLPTLRSGDRAWVPRYETWLVRSGMRSWRAGEVVYFRPPGATAATWLDRVQGGPFLIKRVIAGPGATVELRSGEVWVDGVRVAEPYVSGLGPRIGRAPEAVPPGHVFVLGDNRSPLASRDSRAFGPVPIDAVAGRAAVVIWPLFVREDGGWRWHPHRL